MISFQSSDVTTGRAAMVDPAFFENRRFQEAHIHLAPKGLTLVTVKLPLGSIRVSTLVSSVALYEVYGEYPKDC